jgi:hypothetical protein
LTLSGIGFTILSSESAVNQQKVNIVLVLSERATLSRVESSSRYGGQGRKPEEEGGGVDVEDPS